MSDDSLSEEDKALFRQLMSDVKPLAKSKKVDYPRPKKLAVKVTRPDISKPKKTSLTTNPVYLSDSYSVEVQANTILSYFSHSIPNKRLRELKNGLIPWQSRLDLHGLRPEAASLALVNFILAQSNLAQRCLLIIHGKGSRSNEAPVLKNLVNHWLPQFPQVLAFHSALPRDGGPGALYVLLKRQKEEKN
ncbi:MAG: Smr/MutS family protein [Tatlockia sp.]|nr:Smr/MutS family protein [Tatlockia sp.]